MVSLSPPAEFFARCVVFIRNRSQRITQDILNCLQTILGRRFFLVLDHTFLFFSGSYPCLAISQNLLTLCWRCLYPASPEESLSISYLSIVAIFYYRVSFSFFNRSICEFFMSKHSCMISLMLFGMAVHLMMASCSFSWSLFESC